jgi:PAS domain S-box-containing protein
VLTGIFLVALALLAFIFLLSNWTTGQLIRATQLRDHRHDVIEKLQVLLTELDDAETGERGFLITGEAAYLGPYQSARDTVRRTVKSLGTLLHDPGMRERLAALKPLVEAKISELEETIDLRRTAGFGAAQQVVLTNRGKRVMDEIRKVTGEMRGREETLLAQSETAAATMSQQSNSIRLLGNVLSFSLLLGVFLLLNREIGARRKTEAALRINEERYRLITEQVKDYSILMLDPRGNVETWNAGAQRITGYEPKEIIGRHFSIFYPPEDVEAGKPARELAAAESAERIEDAGWRIRKDGSRFWANTIITGLREEDGKLRGFSKITCDETERKQAQDAMQELNEALERRTADLEAANKELEAFTYSVSHDLRAPLRHVDGFSKMLLDESAAGLSEDAKRYLGYVRDGVIQMGQLVDDLLALARVGRKELSVQVTGLNSLVQDVVAEMKRDNPDRAIEWKVEPLPFVECDAALMKQVFANLLSNAVKYTRPRPKAVIEIGAWQENGQAAVFVRDNGVGFNMKYADKLFGVFQRLHRPEDFEGTGVGLATVQRVIHKHGGRVWVQAAVDQGATFYFTLGSSGESKAPEHPTEGGQA